MALGCGQPDRVPTFELYFNESSIVKLAGALGLEAGVSAARDRFGQESARVLDLYCALAEELGLDALSSNHSVGMEPVDENHVRDRFGTTYILSEHGEPLPTEGPVKERSDVAGIDMASTLRREDFSATEYLVGATDKAQFVCILDPFKLSWRLCGGMENLLVHYRLEPRLVHDLARMTTDFDLAAIGLAKDAGADAIIMPGDLAGEYAAIIAPEDYREYLKPYHRELVDCAHRHGLKAVKHSDGNVWPILDDFIEVGFDAFHPVQPQCMEIGEVKEHLAGKACIIGNIDCRDLLVFGTEDEVERTVKETIEVAAPDGGYIISSSNSIHPGCRPENYIAMLKAARKYGAYGG